MCVLPVRCMHLSKPRPYPHPTVSRYSSLYGERVKKFPDRFSIDAIALKERLNLITINSSCLIRH